ncbi:hypothetical protein UFOVP1414_17 [uncultured Caudovirales phage]|uniref:Uncharacterized protein n=1 Tax=uncultured Caudovirales phage TaxID=2100421 RepID=A0A6J5SD08_9CAUD|nr:hypothetical protein UFOVP442_60 [uncultured Caudovirales phage]CAB4211770.1 hypothetical protein UFOVP1414_17 [uncultured Caudovirales phage]
MKKVSGTSLCDVIVDLGKTPESASTAFIHQRIHFDPRAVMAQTFATSMLVSPGMAEMTSSYIADKACSLAAELYERFARRDWLVRMPSLTELQFMAEGEGGKEDGTAVS